MRAVGEDEVVACLTGPRRPLDHCFLFQGSITFWAPSVSLLLSLRVHDPALDEACRSWLCRRGWACQSREQIDAHAARMGWPGWPPQIRFAAPACSPDAEPGAAADGGA